MPIYEYACEACGHRFEKLMKIGAEAPPCVSCGEDASKKLVSAAAFVLKGSGWYKDHYGLKKAGSTKTETKTESKASTTTSPSTTAPASSSSSGGDKGA